MVWCLLRKPKNLRKYFGSGASEHIGMDCGTATDIETRTSLHLGKDLVEDKQRLHYTYNGMLLLLRRNW